MGTPYTPRSLEGTMELLHAGKVRETYLIPNDPTTLLVVATDNLSTHNVVHESQIPGKGEVLTAITIHWLREVLWGMNNHLYLAGGDIFNNLPRRVEINFPDIRFRAIMVRRLNMIPREFIFRRFLAGSLLKAYQRGEDPYGLNLPNDLKLMSEFPSGPIFTPTDKSETDDPLDAGSVTEEFPGEVGMASVAFSLAQKYAEARGITIIDTKFEMASGVLADEVLTPDSSRFAESKLIQEGEMPPWLDKEVFRQYAERVWEGGPKKPLEFPEDVIVSGVRTYNELLERLTGDDLATWCAKERFNYS